MSDVSPLSGNSGLSFDSTLLSPPLVPLLSLITLSVLSVFCLLVHSPELFSQKILQYFLLRDRLFHMAPVEQPGEVSWSVVCAACCHTALVFAVMHLYTIFDFLLLLSIPFLYFLKILY